MLWTNNYCRALVESGVILSTPSTSLQKVPMHVGLTSILYYKGKCQQVFISQEWNTHAHHHITRVTYACSKNVHKLTLRQTVQGSDTWNETRNMWAVSWETLPIRYYLRTGSLTPTQGQNQTCSQEKRKQNEEKSVLVFNQAFNEKIIK